MCKNICNRSIAYFSSHVMLNSIVHSAGGFGLAVVLQDYLRGNVFISPYVGWALIVVSVIMHARLCMKY